MLRLNTAIPPAKEPNKFGLLGGDLAGFPNGRRVADDVVSISLRAIAGVTVPLVDEKFEPDAAAALVEQGLSVKDCQREAAGEVPVPGHCRSTASTTRRRRERGRTPPPHAGPVRAGHRGAQHRRRHRRAGHPHPGQPARPRDRGQPGRRRRGPHARRGPRPVRARRGAVGAWSSTTCRQGRYVVWRDPVTPLAEVDVRGGAVTEYELAGAGHRADARCRLCGLG